MGSRSQYAAGLLLGRTTGSLPVRAPFDMRGATDLGESPVEWPLLAVQQSLGPRKVQRPEMAAAGIGPPRLDDGSQPGGFSQLTLQAGVWPKLAPVSLTT